MSEGDRRWAEIEIAPYESFDDFVKRGLQKPCIQNWMHFRPQTTFLFVPCKPTLQVDFLGFFENINNDFRYVANRLGMGDSLPLRRENVGNQGNTLDYREFYTDKTRNIVSEVYRRDIDVFGYDFDNSSLQSQLTRRRQRTAYRLC